MRASLTVSLRHLALVVAILGLAAWDGAETGGAPEEGAVAWAEMLSAVNALRAEGGACGGRRMPPVPALAWDDRLESAARGHARDMARHGYFGHTGSDGSDLGERVERSGYDWSAVGENLARHQRTIGDVIADWQASTGHCRQLYDPAFSEVGAAFVDGHWVQVFGYPR